MNKNDHKAHRNKRGLVNPSRIKTFLVYKECELLPFLMEKLAPLSNSNVRHIIAGHQVSVGGAPVSLFKFKLYPEDEVVVSYDKIARHERRNLPIIYEDDDLIAIDKPSGMLSVATEREKGHTAYRLVSDYVTQNDRNGRIFVVHRLDEDTSGVIVFAKKWEVREALQNSWQKIVTKRGYYAIVEGEDIPEQGHLEDYLDQDNFQLVYVTHNKSHGKLAITDYKKIASKKGYSLLDVSISSGRKNQIRVQLGNIGHYVIGDDKYGEPSDPLHRLGLHAYELDLTNPLNNKKYEFKAPMPAEFKRLFWASDKDKKEIAGEMHHGRSEFTRKKKGR
jgi:23S rRNA pseudouridine1911/1915/1917 synthase